MVQLTKLAISDHDFSSLPTHWRVISAQSDGPIIWFRCGPRAPRAPRWQGAGVVGGVE